MTGAEITRLTGMPRDTIRDWKKDKNKNNYRNLIIRFLESMPKETLEEFLRSEGVEIKEFKDRRFKKNL